MQRLNLILGLIILFLIAAFGFELTLMKAVIFSYVLIILFISGYSHKFRFTFMLFGLAVFLSCVLAFWQKEFFIIPSLAFSFSATSLVSYFFQLSFKANLQKFDEKLKCLNGKFSKLKDEDLKALQKNKRLENEVSEIEDLYEITKDMGAALEFEKIFKIFCDVIKKRFNFTQCSLIYIEKKKEGASKIAKVFKISKTAPSEKNIKVSETDKILFEYFLKQKEPVFFKRNSIDTSRERFKLADNITTFLAVPLVVEKDLIGIFSMEDLKEEDFEKPVIVTGQFALEMKKSILYEEVEELALNDGITKLFVRRHFLKRLEEEIERSGRHKLPLALLMIDVDHFKKCNDTYGHLVGDVVLKEVAKIIKDDIRGVDLAGRYGGEEFCVVFPETDAEGAEQVAQRIRAAVEEKKISAYNESIRMTISVGLSIYPRHKKNIIELIEAADKALYKAKEAGRNRVCVYGE